MKKSYVIFLERELKEKEEELDNLTEDYYIFLKLIKGLSTSNYYNNRKVIDRKLNELLDKKTNQLILKLNRKDF